MSKSQLTPCCQHDLLLKPNQYKIYSFYILPGNFSINITFKISWKITWYLHDCICMHIYGERFSKFLFRYKPNSIFLFTYIYIYIYFFNLMFNIKIIVVIFLFIFPIVTLHKWLSQDESPFYAHVTLRAVWHLTLCKISPSQDSYFGHMVNQQIMWGLIWG